MKSSNPLVACSLSSICSSLLTHPLDVMKVRLQTNVSTPPIQMLKQNIHTEGLSFFYRGYTASIMRNGVFVTTKMFTYEVLKKKYNVSTFPEKVACGMTSGFTGAMVGSPFDLVMVKMQNNKQLYPSIHTTIKNTIKNDGLFGFWKGIYYTTCRAIVVTACQFAIYEQMKQELEDRKVFNNQYPIFWCSSITSSIITSVASNPIDVCKTRTINGHTNNTLSSIIEKEGITALKKGLLANTARQVPLNLIRFTFLEFFRKHF